MAKLSKTALAALTRIGSAAEGFSYLSDNEAKPLLTNGLIEVNETMVQDGKKAARLTDAGKVELSNQSKSEPSTENKEQAPMSGIAIITGAILPEAKRGRVGTGAPPKYPFDQLAVGQSFFVPNTDIKSGNALKTLGSTVSSANMRYAKETGEVKTVTRTKRGEGNKAVIENGVKVKEQKQVPVYKFERKFSIRGVKAGVAYGPWTAPADGALIARTE